MPVHATYNQIYKNKKMDMKVDLAGKIEAGCRRRRYRR